MEFLTEQHKIRYENLLERDNTHHRDFERKSMFYLLSGNNDLYSKIDSLYNFNEHLIRTDHQIDLSSSTNKLLYLAFNLYNNYCNCNDDYTVVDLFSSLDSNNFILAINSIKMRFNQ